MQHVFRDESALVAGDRSQSKPPARRHVARRVDGRVRDALQVLVDLDAFCFGFDIARREIKPADIGRAASPVDNHVGVE